MRNVITTALIRDGFREGGFGAYALVKRLLQHFYVVMVCYK
jgi:hypothetical protein